MGMSNDKWAKGKWASKWAVGGVAALAAVAITPVAQAEDFFSALFRGFGVHRSQAPMTPLSFGGEQNAVFPPDGQGARGRIYSYGGSPAHFVRTCDGRHFP